MSQDRSSSLGLELHSLPLPLARLDLASSSTSIQLLGEMFSPKHAPVDPPSVLALPGSPGGAAGQVGVQLGLDFGVLVGIGLEERLGLGLDRKFAQTIAEVEDRVNRRVCQLRAELQRREAELEQERRSRERLRTEKQKVEERAVYLSRQVS